MTVSDKIKKQISLINPGTTFTYKNLAIREEEYQTVAKVFERLVKEGLIKRVSAGVFYKPEQTPFGELKPNETELLNLYLFNKSKRIAYITGTLLYNKMHLTTQVPNNIQIASSKKRIYISAGNIKATPVKSYVDVTNNNFKFLEFLDALKDFNHIPDLDKESGIKILLNNLKCLNTKQILKYALKYPPRVRAFLGALLDQIADGTKLNSLKKSLNPLSTYYYGVNKFLTTTKNWNMK